MIRVFELFCKFNFINISAETLFLQFMAQFNPETHICPHCGVKHPDWEKHATYERCLVSFKNRHAVACRIIVDRYRCSSCKHTHAILPEFIIPYQSYSPLFIIAVMRDYFIGSLTVDGICEKYDIAVSTLYSWKKLFLRHKKIWLGLLDDACTSSLQFLESILSVSVLNRLKKFFLTAGVSFLQGASSMKKAESPPV